VSHQQCHGTIKASDDLAFYCGCGIIWLKFGGSFQKGQREMGKMDRKRQAELRRILECQHQELIQEIQRKKCELRAEKTPLSRSDEDYFGVIESDGIDESVQDEIEISFIQAKSDELHKVEDALWRLERGGYGSCSECDEEISERRLRALPFAVRCRECEEKREVAEQRTRSHRRYGFGLFDGSGADL